MVPEAGIEPARSIDRQILSLLRLPVPPPGHVIWRLKPESNRRPWICNPLYNHSTIQPNYGAGNEARTRDPNLGKVVLYQLSYSRNTCVLYVPKFNNQAFFSLTALIAEFKYCIMETRVKAVATSNKTKPNSFNGMP